MKLVVLQQAKDSMRRSMRVLSGTYSSAYLAKLRKQIFTSIRWLKDNPGAGQLEEGLEQLKLDHRRIVVGPFKVIYRVQRSRIVVTDIFDSRRDPKGMKG